MNVMECPSTERLRASSDLELRLVTILSVGIGRLPRRCPSVVKSSKNIGEVIPKWPSADELLKTPGKVPSAIGVEQLTATGVVPPAISATLTVPAMQPGGS